MAPHHIDNTASIILRNELIGQVVGQDSFSHFHRTITTLIDEFGFRTSLPRLSTLMCHADKCGLPLQEGTRVLKEFDDLNLPSLGETLTGSGNT